MQWWKNERDGDVFGIEAQQGIRGDKKGNWSSKNCQVKFPSCVCQSTEKVPLVVALD